MNLKTLTEQRSDKQNEMESLLNKVEAEQRAFTDEENELFTQLETDISNLNRTIDSIKKGRELAKEPDEEEKEEKKEEEEEVKENEQRALSEERAFESYIRGVLAENISELGAPVPKFLVNAIKKIKDKADPEAEEKTPEI